MISHICRVFSKNSLKCGSTNTTVMM